MNRQTHNRSGLQKPPGAVLLSTVLLNVGSTSQCPILSIAPSRLQRRGSPQSADLTYTTQCTGYLCKFVHASTLAKVLGGL